MYGLEIKVESQYWLRVSFLTAEQKCHCGKVHRTKIFQINRVASASKFPWQRETAHQLNYLSGTLGSNLEFQTSIV